jgi:hypothetical protein
MTMLPHTVSTLVHVLLQGFRVVAQVMLERMQMNSTRERLQLELMVPDGKAPIAAATATELLWLIGWGYLRGDLSERWAQR